MATDGSVGRTRREFLGVVSAGAAVGGIPGRLAANNAGDASGRPYWTGMLARAVEPVLENLAAGTLKAKMPVEAATEGDVPKRRLFTHFEAFGRAMCGLAPWLELADKPPGEIEDARRLAGLARKCLANITDPGCADRMDLGAGPQNLVDAAFLAHAILRAKHELWEKLEPGARDRLIAAIKTVRQFKPGNNNWLLFAAMVEAFLAWAGTDWQEGPIERAVASHEEWYKGDGVYGDGPEFHWDYYNSFVIQPMYIDVLEHIATFTDKWSQVLPKVLARARRYAAIQERLIAPDGTYPAIGRSIAYRCGAFQLLAQMALRDQLPEGVSPAQVRCALEAAMRRTLGANGTFDEGGWLRIGLAGHQQRLAEGYISTGSLYLCTAAFLPLGLPASHPFWSGPAADWTARSLWAGKDMKADHSLYIAPARPR
ncbi:MAG TPA: DUF2264 domain-containing protein [Verrucomicrobiae bacterium]|nr:DUF2264 domain-containing protein [Verrucomicrobiae bacterium]